MKRIFIATLIALSSFVFQIDFYFAGMMTFIALTILLFMGENVDAKEFYLSTSIPLLVSTAFGGLIYTLAYEDTSIAMIIASFALVIFIDRLKVDRSSRKFSYYGVPLVVLAQMLYVHTEYPQSLYLIPFLGMIVALWMLIHHIWKSTDAKGFHSRIYSVNLYISALYHLIFVFIYMTYGQKLNDVLSNKSPSVECFPQHALCTQYETMLSGSFFESQWSTAIFEHYAWSIVFQVVMSFMLTTYLILRHKRLMAA